MSEKEPEYQVEPVVEPQDTRLTLVPNQPAISLAELAKLPTGKGLEILQDQARMLESLKMAGIRMTTSADWMLFKRPDGLETGYLQDSGGSKVRKLWGIQIIPKGGYNKIPMEDGGFIYSLIGDGFCARTGEWIYDVEGIRGTDDANVRDGQGNLKYKGAILEGKVRQNCRANLDGKIVRELAGMEAVPKELLERCGIKTADCAQGRGYSSKERHTEREAVEQGTPACPKCGKPMRVKKGKDGGQFYGCSGYPDCKGTRQIETETTPDEPKGPPTVADLKNDLLERTKDLPANVKAHFGVLIGKAKTEDDCVVVSDELVDWMKRNQKGDAHE